ncbi:NADP-dependent oxidoreductase [Sphaerisporangium corydalis]|uniref:NADP-dependent oxidoreductase n=1 Tax=Sphaerisporangium corydalis TaxID=1441875 RepID=A0ABV9EET9_9ACTN|nr:NADP-dependent oxidoreductase [Sphaerisporangium corydalis]
MRSIAVRRFGGPEVLELIDTPVPDPGPGQIRVKVAGSALNPIDLSARAGRLTEAGLVAPSASLGLGWDVAGHVDALGPDTRRFRPGDAVVGLRDLLFAGGAHAGHVVLDEPAVAKAPTSVSLVEAATLPLNALTADRALGLAGLGRGGTLLVTGASGGVGGFVVELAALRGLRTVAHARPGDVERVRALGADEVVTSADDLGPAVRSIVPGGVDAVVDAAVLGIAAHQALRGAGTFVALVAPFAPPPIRGTRVVVQEVFADGARLAELAALVDAGALTLRVARTLPLEEARAAHTLLEKGGLRGRIVLTP